MKVRMIRLIQNSQEYGTGDDHMVSVVTFSVKDERGKEYIGTCLLKQTVGAPLEHPLEVQAPIGYAGPELGPNLRKAVDHYYRSLVGPGASGISFSGPGSITMINNTFEMPREYEI